MSREEPSGIQTEEEIMAAYRICPRCGAHLDFGEVCHCDVERGMRYAPPAAEVICIHQGKTRAETARDLDRAVWLAAQKYRETKKQKRRKRK